MLFSIQIFLEEYLANRNIVDSDGYAVRLANLYYYYRANIGESQFFKRLSNIRTIIFVKNSIKDRKYFEQSIVRLLDSKFKKKLIQILLVFLAGQRMKEKNTYFFQD